MTRPLAIGLLLGLVFLAAAPALEAASATEVRLFLPVRARLDLEGRETVVVAPFLVVSQEGQMPLVRRGLDLEAEFIRYLRRIIRRETSLTALESVPVQYPTRDLKSLSEDTDFWRAVGERAAADLILSGSLDFDIQDRSGYRTEEYISPFDGRTYYRQVLVEQTGFEYDIVMHVYDGRTGELLHRDNFKDFKQFEGEGSDAFAGMFSNLLALEDRIAGIFTRKRVESSRFLFTE